MFMVFSPQLKVFHGRLLAIAKNRWKRWGAKGRLCALAGTILQAREFFCYINLS
jgi:hypothetical protein